MSDSSHTTSCVSTKVCSRCSETHPAENFYRNKLTRDGLSSWCRPCTDKQSAVSHKLQWARAKSTQYSIDFNTMWEAQHGLCALCEEPMLPRGGASLSVVVDHRHGCCPDKRACGACVRGLIHKRCNLLIGLADDDVELLKAAALYVSGEHK